MAVSWRTGRAAGIDGVSTRARDSFENGVAAGPTIPPALAGLQHHACANGGEWHQGVTLRVVSRYQYSRVQKSAVEKSEALEC